MGNRSDRDEISLIGKQNAMFDVQMRLSSANHHRGRRLHHLHIQAGYKTAVLPVTVSSKWLDLGVASIQELP